MKHLLYLLVAIATTLAQAQTMTPGRAYYIINNYYNRALSYGDSEAVPRLSTVGTNPDETYIFDCIASTEAAGYVHLKQRTSGLWLAATNLNAWGMVLTTEQNSYGAWLVADGTMSCYQSPATILGVDAGKDSETYVGVYYDKVEGERSTWTFVEAIEGGYEASVQAAKEQAAEAAKNNTRAIFLSSGDTLNLGVSYTLGLEGMRFRSATDSIAMILRNNMGMGLNIVMHRDHITLSDGTKCPIYGPLTSTTLHHYRFTCDNGAVTIERNDSLMATVQSEAVPAMTSVGNACEWTLMRSRTTSAVVSAYMPVIYSRTQALKPGEWGTVALGHKGFDVVCINNVKTLVVDEDLDVHILRSNPFIGSCQVSITSDRARVILDRCRPSEVSASTFKINGKTASTASNCRIGIYLTGAVVFATPQSPFIGYTGEQYTGDEIAVSGTGNVNLEKKANEMRSFILRRGYMATLASGEGQSGYTRVYVADHEDLLVPVLPDALNRRVSSVYVKPWQYVSKKGWCSTTSNSAIAAEMKKVNATWFYTWSADRSSTTDAEYIPIRQHIWWPSISQIGGHTKATACLMMNEPEHSEQHNDCDCKGAINEWTAYTKTPEMATLGMRIGSPSPTDMTWLYNYIGHVDDMAARCDFVAIHCYWGTNEAPNAQSWYNQLKAIYDKTKRPIWITEWNNGASWTSEWWPSDYGDRLEKQRKAIKEIVAMLEKADFVERYAIYNWDTDYRCVINWNDGWVTPAGREYRDYPSTFAYNAKMQKVPNWWAPSIKSISLAVENNGDGMGVFSIKNPNGDMTESLTIEQLGADGVWREIYSCTERYLYDSEALSVTLPVTDEGVYRARLTTVRGESTMSAVTAGLVWNDDYTLADASSYITNPDCTDGTNGWTVQNVETLSGEASDGKASNWYWNIWKSSPYTSTMTQTLSNMPRGYYTLTAQLRGQDHVALYLKLTGDGVASQATHYGTNTQSTSDSPYVMGWQDVSTQEVQCLGGTLTLSFTATNPSGAGWWSADHFTLRFRPEVPVGVQSYEATQPAEAPVYDLSGRVAGRGQRGVLIQNKKKVLRR